MQKTIIYTYLIRNPYNKSSKKEPPNRERMDYVERSPDRVNRYTVRHNSTVQSLQYVFHARRGGRYPGGTAPERTRYRVVATSRFAMEWRVRELVLLTSSDVDCSGTGLAGYAQAR